MTVSQSIEINHAAASMHRRTKRQMPSSEHAVNRSHGSPAQEVDNCKNGTKKQKRLRESQSVGKSDSLTANPQYTSPPQTKGVLVEVNELKAQGRQSTNT